MISLTTEGFLLRNGGRYTRGEVCRFSVYKKNYSLTYFDTLVENVGFLETFDEITIIFIIIIVYYYHYELLSRPLNSSV